MVCISHILVTKVLKSVEVKKI